MTDQDLFYDQMVDEALRGVMVRALRVAETHGLPGEHHFYVTFRTDHPRAVVSPDLKARYPEEITIVLQHQYWDLKVGESGFSVSLSFNQHPQTLQVPFSAVTAFVDPSVKFGLQFRSFDNDAPEPAAEPVVAAAPSEAVEQAKGAPENVVAFDRFRKK